MEPEKRVALLIDAENVLPFHAEQIFSYAKSLGVIAYKEIYGAAAAMNIWTEPVLKYLIHANLSIRTTKGKNTSDIALVIGAMDILAAGNVDYFVIASSDSDFSTLALRLRNSGATVIGVGSEPVNPLWKVACSEFVALEAADAEGKLEMLADEDADEGSDSLNSAESLLKTPSAPDDRRELIMKVIEEQITSAGGRVSAPKLFLVLNNLPAYQVDKQTSGFKKAQQYLLGVFGDRIHIENVDAVSWVVLNEAESKEENEEGDENPENDLAGKLVSKGISPEIAEAIEMVMRDTPRLLTVYNRLRSLYGNTEGSEYYHILREVLSSQIDAASSEDTTTD